MRWPDADCGGGSVAEVLAVAREGQDEMSPRLYGVFAASGGGLVRYCRRTRQCVEYSFEIELNRVLDLYCGLVQTGLEMTEHSHRQLTELCVLRRHERARSAPPSVVGIRLVINFARAEEGRGTPELIALPVCRC